MGQFYFAAKAFNILERTDPDPEYWDGKRGACIGVFQQVVAAHHKHGPPVANSSHLREAVVMLKSTSNPQVEYIVGIITGWCRSVGIKL